MALRTNDTKEEQDAAYNPGEVQAAEQFPDAYAKQGTDDAEAFANDPANHDSGDSSDSGSGKKSNQSSKYDGDGNKNRNDAKDKEENTGGWKNSTTAGGAPASNNRLNFSNISKVFKKKGATGFILALLFGGGGFFAFTSLSILPVQLKETIMGDLDDQLTAMDFRSDHVLRARLSGLSPKLSVCTGVKIRCKFTSMSNRQISKFEKAGFKVERENSPIPGRSKVTGLTTPDGKRMGDPGELTRLAKTDPGLRSALHKAYNPKFAGFSDSIAKKMFANFKTDKSKKVVGATDEERNKAVDNATAGDKAFTGLVDKASVVQEDSNGKYYLDGTDKVYENLPDGTANPRFTEIASNPGQVGHINDIAGAGKKATGGVLKAGFKGLSITGAADTACTVYNTARAVAAAAKITRAIQLAQFAMVFFNFADSIKAGDATDTEANYIGKKLTAVDTTKYATDESTITGADSSGVIQTKQTENPFYGKNALDSPGYKVAAYNEAPTLTSRSAQYMVGGGLTGTLANVLDTIAGVIGAGGGNSKEGRANIRSVCKTVQSWWARTIGLIGGLVSSIGTFGISTIVSVGGSLAIGFAMPFLEASLADIVAGTVVNHDTAGVDAGDAVFAGGGALLGGFAQKRGLQPGNKQTLKSYFAATNEVKQQNIASETYDAKDTPFDITKQYSFMGSLVRKINPTIVGSMSSVSAAMTTIPTFIGTAFSSIIPQANAAQIFNEDRFSKCTDSGYEDVGIDADVFCNVRYVLPNDELNMDSTVAVDYMLDHQQINGDTGEAITDSRYAQWQKSCTDRQAGWGESDEADDNNGVGLGAECLTDGEGGDYKYFRVYNIDNPINDGMDAEVDPSAQGGAGTADGSTVSATAPEACKTLAADDLAQISCHAFKFDDYGYLWGGGHDGTAADFMTKFNAGGFVAGTDSIVDCSGLIRMSIYDAFGVDVGGIATSNMLGNSNFVEVSKADAKPGDILLRSGHTEIIVSNDVAGQKFQQFGAHTQDTAFPKQIGPASGTYGAWEHVLRFKKSGVAA